MQDETKSRCRSAWHSKSSANVMRTGLVLFCVYGIGVSDIGAEEPRGKTYYLERGAIYQIPNTEKATVVDVVFVGDNEGFVAPDNTDVSALPFLPRLQSVCLTGSQITDAAVVDLAKCPKLTWLDLSYTSIGSDGLAALRGKLSIKVLDLEATRVDDKACDSIGTLQTLERLDLTNTSISTTGVKQLCKLRRLRWLDLNGCKVGDEGITDIAKSLDKMQELKLAHTDMTDRSLKSLVEMRGLRCLWMEGTQATELGVKEFRRARPDVEVLFSAK